MSPCDHDVTALPVAIPNQFRRYAPKQAGVVRQCPICFRVAPGGSDPVSPQLITDHYPSGEAGSGVVLLFYLLDSIATNRSEIQQLVSELEYAGVDIFSTLSRINRDPDTNPAIDLDRRIRHLEQFL